MATVSASVVFENIKEAHTELLRAYAKAPVNSLHSEITDFRKVLKQLATFCNERGYEQLAASAYWHEGSWDRKDYGDTKFEPVTVPQRRVGTLFDRALESLKSSITPPGAT